MPLGRDLDQFAGDLADTVLEFGLARLPAAAAQPVQLDIGVVGLLMIAPLGQLAADAGQASAPWAQSFGSLLIQWNNMAYSIGEATLGVGGLFLCSLLFTTRLIPGSWRLAASSAT